MKKSIIILSLISMSSCNKFSNQEDTVRKDLSSNKNRDISKIQFETVETTADRAYKVVFDELSKEALDYNDLGLLDDYRKSLSKIDSLNTDFDKVKKNKFFRVHSYSLEGKDTVFNYVHYLNEDKIYCKKSLKISQD